MERIPKSRRCTSRCPAAGWLTCELARNHDGVCVAAGYRWHRGRGHMRPVMVRDFSQETGGRGSLVFGVDRLPVDERWCPAWPRTLDTWRGYARWLRGAADDPGIRLTGGVCRSCRQPFRLGEAVGQRFEPGYGWLSSEVHERCPKSLEAVAA